MLSFFANSLKEFEIIMLIYNRKTMLVKFIMILHAIGCNFLSHPTLNLIQSVDGVQTCLNTNWSTQSAYSGQIIHFCISNQFGNILILYFARSNICHES